MIELAYTAYSGEYDAQYHDAVTVTDADGATVYYGFEMMGWTTDVPKIRNVSDSGVLYIKAEKLNHETLYVEVPFGITKAKLDVYAEDTMIILSDDVPEFTFRAEGFKGSDTLDSLTCDISFGTPYRKGTDPYGTYAITLNGQPVDVNYEIVGHDGILTVAKHKVTVVWLHTEYIYTRTVQEVKVALLDEEGNLTPCGAVVTDRDGNAVEFKDVGDYIATAILDDGYVLDPAQASSLTADVSIVSNEAYELNWEVVAVVVIIVLISAELIYTMFVRRK